MKGEWASGKSKTREQRLHTQAVEAERDTASHTQAVEAEGAVVEEVADVAGLCRHGAEGVGTAGGEGVHADEQHVDQQGPGVALRQEVQRGAEDAEPPQEVPGGAAGSSLDGDNFQTLLMT